MQDLCGADTVVYQTNNTRLAAALCALGFRLIEKRLSYGAIATFDFDPADSIIPTAKQLDYGWNHFEQWERSWPTHPLTYMHRISSARDWIVTQVVHGNHNHELVLPAETFTTYDLYVACYLVADNFYLMKLEKTIRRFHFPVEAEKKSYKDIPAGSPLDWQHKFLLSYDWLIGCISSRKLTRQPKKHPVTS